MGLFKQISFLFAVIFIMIMGSPRSVFAQSPSPCYDVSVALDALQENSSVISNGRGAATVRINSTTNTLQYNLIYSGLTSSESMAHIHGMAPRGQTAGILHTLPMGTPKTGIWTYAETQEQDILNGLSYFNIHTSNYSSGEIRGQIDEKVMVSCTSPLPQPRLLETVMINLPAINTTVGKDSGLSALAYDSVLSPIWNDVTYEWGISSTGSLGSISPVDSNVASFTAMGAGTGDLFVTATYKGQSVTKSIQVIVTDPCLHKNKGDLSCDNKVTLADLSTLLGVFGQMTSAGDVDGNGKVSLSDLSILLSNFGKSL